MNWLSRQFTTRVIVLIPIAIALNIVLGYITQTVLRLPIYLDSIGTILVGVLAGPIAGAATGAATNLIWQYAPVIGGGTIGPFAITAAVIGFLAGLWGYLGIFRPRPASGGQLLIAAAIAAGIVVLLVIPIVGNSTRIWAAIPSGQCQPR
jgi:energy-coupling factor transport system substrate-specific component